MYNKDKIIYEYLDSRYECVFETGDFKGCKIFKIGKSKPSVEYTSGILYFIMIIFGDGSEIYIGKSDPLMAEFSRSTRNHVFEYSKLIKPIEYENKAELINWWESFIYKKSLSKDEFISRYVRNKRIDDILK